MFEVLYIKKKPVSVSHAQSIASQARPGVVLATRSNHSTPGLHPVLQAFPAHPHKKRNYTVLASRHRLNNSTPFSYLKFFLGCLTKLLVSISALN